MAITNKEIMFQFKIENNIPLEEPLYTYAMWKQLGYKVKKGQHAKYHLTMWKHSTKTKVVDDKEVTSGYCFTKVAYLFTKEQVEKIENKIL